MLPIRTLQRNSTTASKASEVAQRRCYFRSGNWSRAAIKAHAPVRSRKTGKVFVLSATIVGAGLYTLYPRNLNAETVPAPAELKFEEKRRSASSKEENRDLISSQHLQVKKSCMLISGP